MIPIKETRTKILLSLFLIPKNETDFDFISFSPTLQKIFDFSLSQKTNRIISKLINDGLVEEKTDDKTYRLTKKGFQTLCLEFPFFRFLKEEWDGLWRVISYEIPEKKREIRDRLRREMRGWGLGPWHRSFWLTPHPIIIDLRNLLFGKEEEKYFQAFESTHVFGDLNILVEKVWKKSELEKRYRDLFKKWHEVLSAQKTNEEKIIDVISSYIELLRLDPGLPEGLIGKKWIGLEAYQIFKEIREILLRQ